MILISLSCKEGHRVGAGRLDASYSRDARTQAKVKCSLATSRETANTLKNTASPSVMTITWRRIRQQVMDDEIPEDAANWDVKKKNEKVKQR